MRRHAAPTVRSAWALVAPVLLSDPVAMSTHSFDAPAITASLIAYRPLTPGRSPPKLDVEAPGCDGPGELAGTGLADAVEDTPGICDVDGVGKVDGKAVPLLLAV